MKKLLVTIVVLFSSSVWAAEPYIRVPWDLTAPVGSIFESVDLITTRKDFIMILTIDPQEKFTDGLPHVSVFYNVTRSDHTLCTWFTPAQSSSQKIVTYGTKARVSIYKNFRYGSETASLTGNVALADLPPSEARSPVSDSACVQEGRDEVEIPSSSLMKGR
jgi:hypothetical protein